MKLYGYWRSSCTWRVRIALAHLGLDFEYVPVHLIKDGGEQTHAAHTSRNQMQQVPTLEVDGRTLSQSLAIFAYLNARYPGKLVSADAFEAALMWQGAEIINSGIQPLQNLSVLQKIKAEFEADAKAWSSHFIGKGFVALESFAAANSGTYLVGDTVSVADMCLIPQMYNARRFAMDLSPYPNLVRIDAACMKLEAFQVSAPDQQSDAH